VDENLTKQIYNFIEFFKEKDPVGLPVPIPDPFPIPDFKKSQNFVTFSMKNASLHEISKFRLKKLSIQLDDEMKGFCAMKFEKLILRGMYTATGGSKGQCEVILHDFEVNSTVILAVERNGLPKVQEIIADMNISGMETELENLGTIGSIIKGFLTFEYLKPKIIKETNEMVKKTIDNFIAEKLEIVSAGGKLPNSIHAVDFAIAEARKIVRAK
jgi:hypothetical protein